MHTGKERDESATMRQHCFISEGKYLIINGVWGQMKPWASLGNGERNERDRAASRYHKIQESMVPEYESEII